MTNANHNWWQMQRRVLDETDAEHFGYCDSLIRLARTGSVGRRLLARTLAANKAFSQIFAAPTEALDPVVEEQPWPAWPKQMVEQSILDLGALTLLPGILLLVDRASVTSIREQLGSERYHRVIHIGHPWSGDVAPALVRAAEREVRTGIAELDLAQRAFKFGLREIRAGNRAGRFSARLERLFGPPDDAGSLAWLPASALAAYWRRQDHVRPSGEQQ